MIPKILSTVVFFLVATCVYSQKYDTRLEKNHGDTIATIFSNSHNYYNFLLYELDYSYEIRSKSEIGSDIKILKASKFKNAAGKILSKKEIIPGKFNFKEWGIVLAQDQPTCIELEDNTILYFYDKVSNNIRFGKSPLNTK